MINVNIFLNRRKNKFLCFVDAHYSIFFKNFYTMRPYFHFKYSANILGAIWE